MLWIPSGKFALLIYLPSFCSKANLENNNSAADKGSVLLKDTSAEHRHISQGYLYVSTITAESCLWMSKQLKSTVPTRVSALINAVRAEHLPHCVHLKHKPSCFYGHRSYSAIHSQGSYKTLKDLDRSKSRFFVRPCCFPPVLAEGCGLTAPQSPLVVGHSSNYWCLWCNLLTVLWPKWLWCYSFVSCLCSGYSTTTSWHPRDKLT